MNYGDLYDQIVKIIENNPKYQMHIESLVNDFFEAGTDVITERDADESTTDADIAQVFDNIQKAAIKFIFLAYVTGFCDANLAKSATFKPKSTAN